MRFPISCPACLDPPPEEWYVFGDVDDTPEGRIFVHGECRHGHKFSWAFDAQRFEVVFEIGVWALADGYTREAVASFAAAKERFIEFYSLLELDGSPGLKDAWKAVHARSEREYGFFQAVFLIAEQRPPPQEDPDDAKWRNKVVHQGYIPTQAEATTFGGRTYNWIHAAGAHIIRRHASRIQDRRARSLEKGPNTMNVGLTFQAHSPENWGRKTFEEAVQGAQNPHLRHWRGPSPPSNGYD